MDTRPKIVLERTNADNLLESLGWLALLLLWGYAIYGYSRLPGIIPTHFNAAGQVDAYGNKLTIFILPLVGTFLFATITVLNKFPQIFNYPVRITADNARAQYTMATRLLRFLKTAIVIVFDVLSYFIHQYAAGNAGGLGAWFLPFMLALLLAPTAYYLFRSFQAK